MMDKDQEIPVKVVDRRWWATQSESDAQEASPASLKPTYVEQLEAQVAEKERQAQEYLAKYRQAAGEFDEARIRLRKEIAKDVERARRDVLAEMLEVVDNLDRAVDAAATATSVDSVLQGIEMVRRQFLSKLENLGVTRMDAAAQPFDPELHDAVTVVPASSADQDGLVVGVVRHGYRIGNEVLRPAAVAVGRANPENS
jgi:molecular chaperone GrpE (heat shock protein)